MCEPTTIALGLAVASSAMAAEQKSAEGKAAKRVAENKQKAELVKYQDDTAMANRQAIEERENATDMAFDNSREVAARTATARVSAGESGIAGLSVDALLLDLAGKGLEANTNAETNYARTTQSMSDQARQRKNGYKTYNPTSQGFTGIDAINTGLSIGSAANNYYVASEKAKAGG